MTWLLIVVAITADTAALLQPNELPRTSLAQALRSMYIERVLVKDITDGVPFETKRACRAAILKMEARDPDPETTPDDGPYKRPCKPVRGEKS